MYSMMLTEQLYSTLVYGPAASQLPLKSKKNKINENKVNRLDDFAVSLYV